MRLWVVILSLLFMSVAAANEGAKESEAEAGVKYMEMTPKFTVNLAEPKKFLLINVQLLVEGAGAIAAVKKHMPALRHELIMLYSGRPSAELQTMEQREALRQETTKVIRETLEKMEGAKGHGESAEEGHADEHKEEGKVEHTEGFKEAYFTEFLVD
ncbi:MAG: flagellar basal body-associated FliL family protein [Methylobacter sp.]|nr:flagellar basal body-associated FliL family protein [Methylobacter sp.]